MKKYLIVGLGNVGDSYYDTRHNIGFDIVNYLAKKHDKDFNIKRYGSVCELKIKNHRIILLKPSTYMNLSGNAVNYYLKKYSIPIQNLLIISDDLDLDFGQIKIKQKGGDVYFKGDDDDLFEDGERLIIRFQMICILTKAQQFLYL